MLKMSFAGCLGLSPVISTQFTLEMCDFVLRNVGLLCILDSGAGRQYNNYNHDVHDIGTSVPYR